MRTTIPSHVDKFLALLCLEDRFKFHLKQINSFAVVDLGPCYDNAPVVKAEFKATYEHCSALFTHKATWKSLYERRVEAAQAYIKKHGPSEPMEILLKRAEENFQKL